jgi:hypothetical protein
LGGAAGAVAASERANKKSDAVIFGFMVDCLALLANK